MIKRQRKVNIPKIQQMVQSNKQKYWQSMDQKAKKQKIVKNYNMVFQVINKFKNLIKNSLEQKRQQRSGELNVVKVIRSKVKKEGNHQNQNQSCEGIFVQAINQQKKLHDIPLQKNVWKNVVSYKKQEKKEEERLEVNADIDIDIGPFQGGGHQHMYNTNQDYEASDDDLDVFMNQQQSQQQFWKSSRKYVANNQTINQNKTNGIQRNNQQSVKNCDKTRIRNNREMCKLMKIMVNSQSDQQERQVGLCQKSMDVHQRIERDEQIDCEDRVGVSNSGCLQYIN